MPAINNGNFYNATPGQKSGGSNKQMLFLGIGIVIVIVATYITYRYFTQGAGENVPVVNTQEVPGVQPINQEEGGGLPPEAQEIQDALNIYNAIADVPLDTEFFNRATFKDLVEYPINIPDASPRPGRIFELWAPPQTGAKAPASAGTTPPPAGDTSIRIRR